MVLVMATEPRIGTKIRRARERKRMSQSELGAAVGVSRTTVNAWENDRTFPQSSIGAIEEVLGISLDVPVTEEEKIEALEAQAAELLEAARRMRAARLRRNQDDEDVGHRHAI